MKVLFAVHDEKVSSSIVKKYQRVYKEIISYKNVYYYNAIIKELQRDKTYNRIVIDEDLLGSEVSKSNYFDQKDKVIFDKLDSISDEATDANSNDIPIILICSERRAKSDEFLVKLFGLGIYNAIVGNDRSTDEVCRLIKKARSKKEAKSYYKIDSEDTGYQPESVDEVSEEEMQHILSYFKKLGSNEQKYVDGFRNIVSQYNEKQLRIIVSILPENVKNILAENSPEYQKLVFGNDKRKINSYVKDKKMEATSEKLLIKNAKSNVSRPIVVPSRLEKTLVKDINPVKKVEHPQPENFDTEDDFVDFQDDYEDDFVDDNNDIQAQQEPIKPPEPPVKRKRGRPRKNSIVEPEPEPEPVKKRRGRPPKKKPIEEEPETVEESKPKEVVQHKKEPTDLDGLDDIDDNNTLPGFDDYDDDDDYFDDDLPNLDDLEKAENIPPQEDTETNTLPGFEEDDENYNSTENNSSESNILPGFEDSNDDFEDNNYNYETQQVNNQNINQVSNSLKEEPQFESDYDFTEYNSLLSSTRKVVAFVGTSKNGISFIVNNIAKILSDSGINTAILDATKNRNAYYIYTKNEEELRRQATMSISNLIKGNQSGIKVKNNLTVYTELPNGENSLGYSGQILENLVKQYSAVLIDCDFTTPMDYFKHAQEIFLVQSMDVLTIQPLTAFLRELKAKNILDERKLKIIINKTVKIRGVNPKTIVGGMAFYNDPEMSYMTELFDRNSIEPIDIPFDLNAYELYLEGLIECEITTDRYPKDFQNILKDLASVVYPLLPAKKTKERPKRGYHYDATSDYSNNGFSDSVNNTLNNMRKNLRK